MITKSTNDIYNIFEDQLKCYDFHLIIFGRVRANN